MCLESVDFFTRKYIKTGYKVFLKEDDKLYSPIFVKRHRPFEVGKWIEDTAAHNITSYSDKEYKTGFHVFKFLKDVYVEMMNGPYYHDIVIFKVQVKNIVASGKQYNLKVVVARKIKLLKEII